VLTYRLDQNDRRLVLRSMTIDPDTGFARITGVVAAPGELEYPEIGMTETVGVRALSDPAANDTLRGAPVVRLHPGENDGRVDVSNVSWLRVGTVLDVRWVPEAEELLFEAQLEDPATIAEVQLAKATGAAPDTLADCSPGYDVIEKSGDEQVRRKYNHLALVPYGRGERARIHLDAQPTDPPKEADVTPEEMKAMLAEQREDMQKMITDAFEAKAQADAAEKQAAIDAEGMPLELTEIEKADEAKRMDALVTKRAEQRRIVAAVASKAGVEWKTDANVFANMRNVLEKKAPKSYRADASDEMVAGMFHLYSETLAETATKPAKSSLNFDGFGVFDLPVEPKGEPTNRNDSADPIGDTLNSLRDARSKR